MAIRSLLLFIILTLFLLQNHAIPHSKHKARTKTINNRSLKYSFLQAKSTMTSRAHEEPQLGQDELQELQYYLDMLLDDEEQFNVLFFQAFKSACPVPDDCNQVTKSDFVSGLKAFSGIVGIRCPSSEDFQVIYEKTEVESKVILEIEQAQKGVLQYLKNIKEETEGALTQNNDQESFIEAKVKEISI